MYLNEDRQEKPGNGKQAPLATPVIHLGFVTTGDTTPAPGGFTTQQRTRSGHEFFFPAIFHFFPTTGRFFPNPPNIFPIFYV